MAFDVKAYLETYRRDHTHPVNQVLHTIGIPMIIASLGVLPFNPMVGSSMFVLGWVLQFIGHAFEGKLPSFFRDPKFLLIGAMWFWNKLTGQAAPAEAMN